MEDVSSSSLPASSAVVASPPPEPLWLTFDAPAVNPVEEAGQNHFERFTPPLSSLERFYVAVAQAFAQQEVDRRKADDSTAEQRRGSRAAPPLPLDPAPSPAPLSSTHLILQHLSRTAHSLDHFLAMLDSLLSQRQLSLALTQPQRDPKVADAADDPTSPAFLVTRRNRLAVLLQSHAGHLQSTAVLLSRGASSLRRALRLHHRFMADLARLSAHWLVRHKPTTATSVLPPLMVDLSLDALIPASSARVMLRRDDDGRVAVDDSVGPLPASAALRLDARQRRRRARQQRREERQRAQQPDTDMEDWKADDDTGTATAPRPTPIAWATSAHGWVGAAARLHRAQRQLLHAHLQAALLREAQGAPLSHLCTVSVVHHRMTVEASAFPTLWLDWDEGPTGPFTVRTASRALTAALQGDALPLSLLPPLLQHSARHSTGNQPLALAALATAPIVPPLPPLLAHVITCAYHAHLALSVRALLAELVLPHPSVALWLPGPPELNVQTFTLHRDAIFMLQCVVAGVDIAVVARRSVKAQAVGLARLRTAGEAEEWNADFVDGPCGHAAVDAIQCSGLQHLRELIHFAVHQPLHSQAQPPP